MNDRVMPPAIAARPAGQRTTALWIRKYIIVVYELHLLCRLALDFSFAYLYNYIFSLRCLLVLANRWTAFPHSITLFHT